MHIVALTGSFYPQLMAPSACIKPYLLELAKENEVEVVCPVSDPRYIDNEEIDGIHVHFVSNRFNDISVKANSNREESKNRISSKFMSLFVRGFRYLKEVAHPRPYDSSLEDAYLQKLKEINAKKRIDVLISVTFPFCTHVFALKFKQQNSGVKWLTYTTDPLAYNEANPIPTWKKKSALPNNVSTNKLTRITEFVFVICRKEEYKTFRANKKVTKIGSNGQKYYENVFNYIEAPNNDGPCKLNKATYSSDLCLQLLSIYATNDSKVYDPFMGTGTTAIACDMFNEGTEMVCTGSELSEAQVEFSKKRLNESRWKRKQLEIPFDCIETHAVNAYNQLKSILKNEIMAELNTIGKKGDKIEDKEITSFMELLVDKIKPVLKLYGKNISIN